MNHCVRCTSQLECWCRSFGTYQSELWDDVFSEFEPITEDDIILVNFAAWYPKYKITEPYVPYEQWEESMAGMALSFLQHNRSPSAIMHSTHSRGGACSSAEDLPDQRHVRSLYAWQHRTCLPAQPVREDARQASSWARTLDTSLLA